jgi:predicted phosphoribosyltransferase
MSEDVESGKLLTNEQVRHAASVAVAVPLTPGTRHQKVRAEADLQFCFSDQNSSEARSRRRKRRTTLTRVAINPCIVKSV